MAGGLKPSPGAAYYTVADAAHFPGAVALLNSLRLLGEEAPFFVVDCGLNESQRTRLSRHATLVPSRRDLHPWMQKTMGPLAHPAEMMILLDADVIVTKRLTPLLEEASRGRILVFENDHERFFPEWASLGFGDPQPRPYVNAGYLILSFETASEFLPLHVDALERLDPAETMFGGASPSSPFFFGDQEILNALLSVRFDGRVTRLEHRLAPFPPFPGLRIVDLQRLRCEYSDGTSPFFLHHVLRKPWLAALKPNVYSQLFARLVSAPDVRLPLGPGDVPPRLRGGRLSHVDRWQASLQSELHSRLRGRLGIHPALERYARRISRARTS